MCYWANIDFLILQRVCVHMQKENKEFDVISWSAAFCLGSQFS